MRRFALPAVLVALTLTITGCGTTPGGTLNTSNFWGKFVLIISNTIDYFANLIGDYGVAILIVTLIIRIIVFPLMYKQLKHSKLMQQLQPEMTKIREKYKTDQKKMNEEMMKLFGEYGTNPLAGCFPVVVQMPILIALYQAINTNQHLKVATFLGVLALGHPPTISDVTTFILPIVTALTTYWQQKMMMTSNDPQQKMLLYIMPLMIGGFSFTFPAALALYWSFGNLLTIAQLYLLRPVKPLKGGTSK